MHEDFLADQFEENRAHLQQVAYRMLGSTAEADDAVQEAWLRLSGRTRAEIENLAGLADDRHGADLPEHAADPRRPGERTSGRRQGPRPDHHERRAPSEEAELSADSVGLALLVVLEVCRQPSAWRSSSTTSSPCRSTRSPRSSTVPRPPASWPAERGGGSEGRQSLTQTCQLRGRVVNAFSKPREAATCRALLAVLDPDVVLRADLGARRAAHDKRRRAGRHQRQMFATPDRTEHPVLVNGRPAPSSSSTASPSASWPSPSPTAGSSRSRSSLTRTRCTDPRRHCGLSAQFVRVGSNRRS